VRILGLPLGSPRTKWHLDAGPVARHIVYYKKEGGGFPQVQAVVSLVSPNLPMVRPNTKSALAMHWPTCCLVWCKFVWVSDCFSFFLLWSQSFSTPLYPQNSTSQGVCPNSLLFHCFHLTLTFESIKELGSASKWPIDFNQVGHLIKLDKANHMFGQNDQWFSSPIENPMLVNRPN
jgi:hypothetical protein